MQNTQSTEEIEILKKENTFLKLRLLSAKKKYHTLRAKFETLQQRFFNGIRSFTSKDESLFEEFHVSTTKYAEANGFKPKDVFTILQSAGIITKAGKLVYLTNPAEHGKYVLMVNHDYGALKRNLLYWNADGVKFLNSLLSGYGMEPKAYLD